MPLFIPTRREILAAASTAAALAAAPHVWARAADPALSFVAVGDWGRDGASHQRDVAAQMGKAAASIGSRFTASTGDNFYETGVKTAQDAQWKTSFEDVYTDPALQSDWFTVLGNHDYRGVPQAELDYAKTSKRWRMPSRYYSVSGRDIGFADADLFFIDTSPMVHKYRQKVDTLIARHVVSQDVPTQLAWLDTALGRSTAPWKLVFGHHTIYSGGSEHGNTRELIAQVKPLLEKHGVQAYINGHEHDLQHLRVGNVDYICTGAGSKVRPTGKIDGTLFALSRSGFATFRLDRSALRLEFKDFRGTSVYSAAIARQRLAVAA